MHEDILTQRGMTTDLDLGEQRHPVTTISRTRYRPASYRASLESTGVVRDSGDGALDRGPGT